MDEWALISSKIPSFDVVPHRVASPGSDPLRLSRSDWKVAGLADGRKSIRQIAAELDIDVFEAGRAIFGLITMGALSFESDKNERDVFFDAVPELKSDLRGDEPYELSAVSWKLLASIDGTRDLGAITHLVGVAPRRIAELLKDLADRGFIKVNMPSNPKAEAPHSKENGKSADSARVEAFTPRIRVIGLD